MAASDLLMGAAGLLGVGAAAALINKRPASAALLQHSSNNSTLATSNGSEAGGGSGGRPPVREHISQPAFCPLDENLCYSKATTFHRMLLLLLETPNSTPLRSLP